MTTHDHLAWLTSTAMATGAKVRASLDIGLMMTSHMEMIVGGASGDTICTHKQHSGSKQGSSVRRRAVRLQA